MIKLTPIICCLLVLAIILYELDMDKHCYLYNLTNKSKNSTLVQINV